MQQHRLRETASFLICTCTPVSYTHLDVYKRQREESPLGRGDVVDGSYCFNQLCSGAFDDFKRAFQLGKLPSAAPPGEDVYKRQEEIKGVLAEIWRLQRLSLLKAL